MDPAAAWSGLLCRTPGAKPIQIDVDDLPLAEGLRLKSFSEGSPDAVVSGGKIVIDQPREIQIYWVAAGPR